MEGTCEKIELGGLLENASWLRGLAHKLVDDAAAADDVVQETWLAALRSPPDLQRPPRPWLGTVLRNAIRKGYRGGQRRDARESEVARLRGDSVPSSEDVLARAEQQRLLSDQVLKLPEPYRSTVLLHYYEGLTLAEIARREGIAAGTARWRLSEALERLRTELDERHGGDRRRWALAMVPLAKGAGNMRGLGIGKLVALVLAILALVGVGVTITFGAKGVGSNEQQQAGHASASTNVVARVATHATGSLQSAQSVPAWYGQPGAPDRSIAGVVLVEDKPLAGARVWLASSLYYRHLLGPLQVTTDATGRFSFGTRRADHYWVVVEAAGFEPLIKPIDLRNPTLSPPPNKLALHLLSCRATAYGVVTDAVGSPIPDASVKYVPAYGAGGTITDASGNYALCVPAGLARLKVRAAGYGVVRLEMRASRRVRRDVMLMPEATVYGAVVGSDGEPVGGAQIHSSAVDSGPNRGGGTETVADARGRFTLCGLNPGLHWVWANSGDGAPASSDFMVEVTAGDAREILLRVAPRAILRGHVMSEGQPVAGVKLRAFHSGDIGRSRYAISQLDGSFALVKVPFGKISVTSTSHDVVGPAAIDVKRSQQRGVVVEVKPRATIRGVVRRRGAPVPFATVLTEDRVGRVWARTARDGTYELAGLKAGSYSLRAYEMRQGAAVDSVTVTVAAGEAKKNVTLELKYAGRISGMVVDQGGEPVVGARVEYLDKKTYHRNWTTTAADGSFTCKTLKGGLSYRPRVYPSADAAKPFRPAGGSWGPIRLADDEATTEGIRLVVRRAQRSIVGTVIDNSGSPVPDARVSLLSMYRHDNRRYVLPEPFVISDSDGTFQIDGLLSSGRYLVRARTADGSQGSSRILGDATEVVVRIARAGRIEGTLVGFSKKPRVIVLPHPDPPLNTHIFGRVAGDRFTASGLAPGRYSVTANSPANGDSKIIEIRAGEATQVTLRSRGGGRVEARAVELQSGEPIAAALCRYRMRVGGWFTASAYNSDRYQSQRTDSTGRIMLEQVPAGQIFIECYPPSKQHATGGRALVLTAGQHAKVTIAMAKKSTRSSSGNLGLQTDALAVSPLVTSVHPTGRAAAAGLLPGDTIIAVDGQKLDGIHPRSALAVISDKGQSSDVRLTVRRSNGVVALTLPLPQPSAR